MPSREQIEKLLKAEPDDVFLNFGLAMELQKAGLTEDAIARFDRVILLDPAYTAAYYHKGNTLIALGRGEEAKAVLLEGVEATRQAGNRHAESEMKTLLESLSA